MLKSLLFYTRRAEPFNEQVIQMGINAQMAQEHRHGVAWVNTGDEVLTPLNFSVDHPQALRRPTPATAHQLFEQLEKMGFAAQTVEITTGRRTKIFHLQ